MSLTTTISWWSSSSNPTSSSALGSSVSPLNSSSYASAIRRGVSRSPSRSMSSPIAVIISRTACSMTGLSTLPDLLWRPHRPAAGEELHHPHHPHHRLHILHPQHVGPLRRGEGHRRRGSLEELLRMQVEQVGDVVLP